MSQLSPILRDLEGGLLAFWCPGCNDAHQVRVVAWHGQPCWEWNGNVEQPTFSPSILLRTGHYADHFKPGEECWCTYNREHPDQKAPYVCVICHSFVRDGQIQFLSDCTHSLAGHTVPLPPWTEVAS